jgi:hypothetical protein
VKPGCPHLAGGDLGDPPGERHIERRRQADGRREDGRGREIHPVPVDGVRPDQQRNAQAARLRLLLQVVGLERPRHLQERTHAPRAHQLDLLSERQTVADHLVRVLGAARRDFPDVLTHLPDLFVERHLSQEELRPPRGRERGIEVAGIVLHRASGG